MKRVRKTLTVVTAVGLTFGFTIAQAQAQDENITYNSHVAKLINDNCVVCHREGAIGPMQLTNFDQVRPGAADSA